VSDPCVRGCDICLHGMLGVHAATGAMSNASIITAAIAADIASPTSGMTVSPLPDKPGAIVVRGPDRTMNAFDLRQKTNPRLN
jgi:hypothetical protein